MTRLCNGFFVGLMLPLLVLGALALGACSGGTVIQTETGSESSLSLSAKPITDGLVAHRPAVAGTNGLVTAGHPLASMAGMRILLQGGTAADAAVAVLATLNLVEPMMSGAGGNGFMTIYEADSGQVYSLNATGAAPAALDASEVTAEDLARGMRAGVVPGLFGGWVALLERFGTMELAQVLEPAVEYAEDGHPLAPLVADSIEQSRELLERFETTRAVFFPTGESPVVGGLFAYSDLARTFKKLIEAEQTAIADGASRRRSLRAAFDRFYRGDIAREMARFYQQNGGLFTREDFASYEPIWAEPAHVTYRGYDVYSSPSTSRGGLEVTMQLNLMEHFDLASLGHNSSQALHLIAESIKVAKADIYHFVADPKMTDMPTAGMLSKKFAETRVTLIQPGRAMEQPDHGNPPGARTVDRRSVATYGSVRSDRSYPGSTTSFSVVDGQGNVVVCTPTLGSRWGTGVIVGTTGLFFNNGTRHGSTSPYPDDVNYARGGQIPILNNSPTLVMKDGAFFLALGTPGGETIGQTQFQVLLNIIDFGMGIQEAIEAPRIALSANPNFYRPGADITVRIEARMAPQVVADLEAMGHIVETVGEYAFGNMQGVLVNSEVGTMMAGADARRMMYAVGW